MNIIKQGKVARGLYKDGKKYGGYSETPQIKYTLTQSVPYKMLPGVGTEYTSGYKVTFSTKPEVKFNIYLQDDLTSPINYIPEHSFILYSTTETKISGLSLVYDGDYLFHIEGSTDVSIYSGEKYSVSYYLVLVDKNGNLLLTTTGYTSVPILASTASSTTTVTFLNSSATLQRRENALSSQEIKDITLPFSLLNGSATDGFENLKSYQAIGSNISLYGSNSAKSYIQ